MPEKYQLWSVDEYGQGSIIFSSEDVNAVMKRGMDEVTDINVHNSLTADDRERNWEAYMVIIPDIKKNKKAVFGGKSPHIKNIVYVFDKDEYAETTSLEKLKKENEIKIYLGNISFESKVEKGWFAKNQKGIVITNLDSPDLKNKTCYFIKKV